MLMQAASEKEIRVTLTLVLNECSADLVYNKSDTTALSFNMGSIAVRIEIDCITKIAKETKTYLFEKRKHREKPLAVISFHTGTFWWYKALVIFGIMTSLCTLAVISSIQVPSGDIKHWLSLA